MNVSGVSSAAIQQGTAGMTPVAGGQMDAVSRDLQNQIKNLQQQIQELSANQDMPAQIKAKKKQELQKQISDLEMQLRQHQMEVKREERQKKQEKGTSMDEMLGTKKQQGQEGRQSAGLSAGSMEALISADRSVKQADVHGSTARSMENRAGILEEEIKQDKGKAGDATAAKEEQLAEVKELANRATTSQMDSLAEANKTMQDASSKEEQEPGKTKKEEEVKTLSDMEKQKSEGTKQDENSENRTYDVEMPGVAFSRGYQPVDIRL